MQIITTARPRCTDGIVIAGGGLAGQRCAETLRREGFDRPIRIACAERHRPYDRPPLSKGVLMGTHDDSALPYRRPEWYSQHAVDLLPGVRASGLDPTDRVLRLSDGSALRYEQLLIATGGTPKRLPPLASYENVSALHTLDDARYLRQVLRTSPRLAVIGAGFVGLEVAATARSLDAEVTVVEAGPEPLIGVLGPQLGAWFRKLHATEGVRMLTRRTIERVEANGKVQALRLSDGMALGVDHVVVGIGIAPDTAWVAGSGLPARGGIPVDEQGRSPVPGVFAAGDAAATFDPRARRHLPGSHWEAAGRQGVRVARAMLGLDAGSAPLTSFWTDQFGMRIQFVGRAEPGDEVEVEGDVPGRSFTATFIRAGRVVAALLVNRPRSLPAARKMIEKGSP